MFIAIYPWNSLENCVYNIVDAVGEKSDHNVETVVLDVKQSCTKETRQFLLEHQITAIPAVLVSGSSKIVGGDIFYPSSLLKSEGSIRPIENIVAEALEAYNSFDIDLAIQR